MILYDGISAGYWWVCPTILLLSRWRSTPWCLESRVYQSWGWGNNAQVNLRILWMLLYVLKRCDTLFHWAGERWLGVEWALFREFANSPAITHVVLPTRSWCYALNLLLEPPTCCCRYPFDLPWEPPTCSLLPRSELILGTSNTLLLLHSKLNLPWELPTRYLMLRS